MKMDRTFHFSSSSFCFYYCVWRYCRSFIRYRPLLPYRHPWYYTTFDRCCKPNDSTERGLLVFSRHVTINVFPFISCFIIFRETFSFLRHIIAKCDRYMTLLRQEIAKCPLYGGLTSYENVIILCSLQLVVSWILCKI